MERSVKQYFRSTTHYRALVRRNVSRHFLKPSLFDLLLCSLALLTATAFSSILINADGDMARHIVVGEVILSERALPATDRFSNSRQSATFLPFEWGSELIFALFHRAGGLPGVAILTGLIIGITYGLIAIFLERRRVHPLLIVATIGLSILVGMIHWLPRPHMFSALGAILVIMLLESRSTRVPWIVVPFFAVWANLHGAFTWGLALIGLYALGSLVESRFGTERDEWQKLARLRGITFVLALGGSLLNPFGYQLHGHIIGYLNEDFIISHTADFIPPNFREPGPQIFMFAVIAIVVGFALSSRRPSLPHLLVIVATIAFSLHALRNIPLFAVTALPLFAMHMDAAWRHFRKTSSDVTPIKASPRRTMPGALSATTCLVLLMLLVSDGSVGGTPVSTQSFSDDRYPVDAVMAARNADLAGNMFNEFLWGGYILYAWPEQRVFIDGQTAFYGEEVTRTYGEIIGLTDGWREKLDSNNIDFILFPPNWPIALELGREPGWQEWYRDDVAVILVRSSESALDNHQR